MVDARLFQALSDATRLKVLSLLAKSSMNVSKIVDEVKSAQPAVSRHLRVLKEVGLISDTRKGKEVEYSLNPERLRDAAEFLEKLSGGPARPRTPAQERPAREPRAKATRPKRAARKAPAGEDQYLIEKKEDSMDDFLL